MKVFFINISCKSSKSAGNNDQKLMARKHCALILKSNSNSNKCGLRYSFGPQANSKFEYRLKE